MFGRSLQLTLALLLSLVLVAGCAAGKEESAYLAQPKAGDLYAVELSHFSGSEFGEDETSYGLMKVIQVTPDQVVFVTENAGWPNPQSARNDLHGDLSGITWDNSEKIPVRRADLPGYYGNRIIEIRRMDTAPVTASGEG